MEPIEINTLSDDALAPYASLTERQLRNRRTPSEGLFIVESPKVIAVALDAGMEPVSLLCEHRHLTGDAAAIIARMPHTPVYIGSRDLLSELTGYTLTRGVLCCMRRPPEKSPADVLGSAARVAVVDSVVDNTNIGAIFRSAAALGIDAVALTRTSCDPLNRRSVRVSMGSVFLVPWTWVDSVEQVRDYGLKTVAMALTDQSVPIDDPTLNDEPRLAIVLGTEGDGLAHGVIANADYTARIPMMHGVDSLNVAAASAVAFWQLRKGAR